MFCTTYPLRQKVHTRLVASGDATGDGVNRAATTPMMPGWTPSGALTRTCRARTITS